MIFRSMYGCSEWTPNPFPHNIASVLTQAHYFANYACLPSCLPRHVSSLFTLKHFSVTLDIHTVNPSTVMSCCITYEVTAPRTPEWIAVEMPLPAHFWSVLWVTPFSMCTQTYTCRGPPFSLYQEKSHTLLCNSSSSSPVCWATPPVQVGARGSYVDTWPWLCQMLFPHSPPSPTKVSPCAQDCQIRMLGERVYAFLTNLPDSLPRAVSNSAPSLPNSSSATHRAATLRFHSTTDPIRWCLLVCTCTSQVDNLWSRLLLPPLPSLCTALCPLTQYAVSAAVLTGTPGFNTGP